MLPNITFSNIILHNTISYEKSEYNAHTLMNSCSLAITLLASSIALVSFYAYIYSPSFAVGITAIIALVTALSAFMCIAHISINNKFSADKDKLVTSSAKPYIEFEFKKYNGKYYLVFSENELKGYSEKAKEEVLNFNTIIADKWHRTINGEVVDPYYKKLHLHFSKDFHKVYNYHKAYNEADNKIDDKAVSYYYKELEWFEEFKNNSPLKEYPKCTEGQLTEYILSPKNFKSLKKYSNEEIEKFTELKKGKCYIPSPDTAEEMAKTPNNLLNWISLKLQPNTRSVHVQN
ncbi:hypothetical protein [Wolbachia endosymbiont of Ctenocephalides felis wCfeT]|uniref:hypothetical protein n=1 Tax=Wolbachia endosymbiont of Ctenocephalides felis wCfeT TaxID=2732593 RepID=UPI001445C8F9|nr:hypothetical protein [Wolbachia endosymbiont of Ctenocephalides felis wCfeT]